MRHFHFCLPILAIASLFSGCDRSAKPIPVPGDPPGENPKPSTESETVSVPADAPAPPALTEAAIESLIFDALSPTDPDVASADNPKFSPSQLPDAQRKTLNEAITKAISKIDFKALLTSIAGNLEVGGLDLNGLPGNMQVSTRVLTPEEAEKFGIKIQGLEDEDATEDGSKKVSISSMQVITIGSPESAVFPQNNDAEEGDSATTEPGNRIQEITSMEVTEDDDPERAKRFQSLLESGDSDALAGEIADLIQSSIDTATLQQAMQE